MRSCTFKSGKRLGIRNKETQVGRILPINAQTLAVSSTQGSSYMVIIPNDAAGNVKPLRSSHFELVLCSINKWLRFYRCMTEDNSEGAFYRRANSWSLILFG